MYVSGWHFTCFLMNTCIIYPTGVYCKRDIWQKDNIFYHLWFCFHTKQISCDNIFLWKIKFNMTPNAISVPYLGNCIICCILNIEKVIGTSQLKYLWLFFVVDLKILICRGNMHWLWWNILAPRGWLTEGCEGRATGQESNVTRFRSGAAASGTKFSAPLTRHCSLSAGRITRSLMESCPVSRPCTFPVP